MCYIKTARCAENQFWGLKRPSPEPRGCAIQIPATATLQGSAECSSNSHSYLAAVEKRLQVHQEAFCLWRKINGALGTNSLPEIIKECDEWWGKNSLYLEPEPRRAFLEAWVAARDLKWYQENSEPSLVTKCHQQIDYVGEAITKAVELPRLNELIDTKAPNKSMQPTATASAD